MKTLAAIGDVHAEDATLGEILRYLRKRGIDLTVCVGDVVDGEGSVDKCCALLESERVVTVRGNHDRWCLEGQMRRLEGATKWLDLSANSRRFLADLPTSYRFPTPRGPALLCHGWGDDDMARRSAANMQSLSILANSDDHPPSIVIHGHTHAPSLSRMGGSVVVNCGTLREGPSTPSFAIFDFENATVTLFKKHLAIGQVMHFDKGVLDT